MFRFGEPLYLYLLIVVPILAAFYFYSNYRRRKRLKEYGDMELLKQLMPEVSKYRPDVKFWLLLAAMVMVIFMLAQPQFGSKMETVKRQGIETVVALTIGILAVANVPKASTAVPNEYKDFTIFFFILTYLLLFI